MEIKLARTRLKQLRKQQLWSQEELAAASGLGLRTIQRAEGEGAASGETLKALAATLEVSRDELLESNDHSFPYLNTQFGYVTTGSMLVVVMVATLAFSKGGIPVELFITLSGVSTVVAALFATLTTRVDENQVKWHFGIGLIRKKLKLDEIESHRAVRNKAWWGWGIRLIPNGWLYNVSGLDAVELRLKDGRAVRIGTDEPKAFDAAIVRALLESS